MTSKIFGEGQFIFQSQHVKTIVFRTEKVSWNNTFDKESARKTSVIARIEMTKQSVLTGCGIASGALPRSDV